MQPLVLAQLGVEGDGRARSPWRAAIGWPSTSAEDLTPGPCSAIQGARMKIARSGRAIHARDLHLGLEAADLAPEGVALGAACP